MRRGLIARRLFFASPLSKSRRLPVPAASDDSAYAGGSARDESSCDGSSRGESSRGDGPRRDAPGFDAPDEDSPSERKSGGGGDTAVRPGDRLTYADLQAAAHRLLSASDYTHAEMAERLEVAPVSVSKAVTEPGRKFRQLQMQIVETLTGLRLEIDERILVREEPAEEGGQAETGGKVGDG